MISVDGGGSISASGVFFVCRFPVINQRLVFVILLSPGRDPPGQGAEALGSTSAACPIGSAARPWLFQTRPPLIQKDDVIRHLLQVAGDVERRSARRLLVLHGKSHSSPEYRLTTGSSPLVGSSSTSSRDPCESSRDDGQLRARALTSRSVSDPAHPSRSSSAACPVRQEDGDPAKDAPQLRGRKHVRKVVPVKYHAHLPERFASSVSFPSTLHAPASLHQAGAALISVLLPRRFHRSARPCRAVRSGYVLQPKAGICLGKAPAPSVPFPSSWSS